MSGPRTAIVAGAGVGGLATAIALARGGFRVSVLERAARIGHNGAGLLLHQNGIAAASALAPGLGERIRAVGHAVEPGDVRLLIDPAGRVLAREPIGLLTERTGLPQVPILRRALHQVLADEARTAGAEIHTGCPVAGYTERSDHVVVRLADGSDRAAALVIGADGIRSAIRSQMLGDGPPRYRGYSSVRGHTAGSELYPQAFVTSGRGLQLFVAPADDKSLYWTAKITAGAGEWERLSPEQARAALLRRMSGWQAGAVALIREADVADILVTDIHDRDPVDRWVDGRVALLGDAAHPMVPALGQGANQALEDAVVLGSALARNSDVATALLDYQGRRIPRASRVMSLSRWQGDLDQGAGRFGAWLRDTAMRVRRRKDSHSLDVISWRPSEA
jgi:salicylate hydroxylase